MSNKKQQPPKGDSGAASNSNENSGGNPEQSNEGAKKVIAPKFNFDDSLYNELAEKYKVPEREKNCFHVIQEVKAFDNQTGKRLSQPVIQIYENLEFPLIESALKRQGFTFAIIHNPSGLLNDGGCE